ncbi:hypothetical protein [Chroococcidiopsis sp. CCMEE 29]|uniref:hypothetical protein n=1 Tax=Chroococcidiopsis sp. CCMEE 29 TaxID=155894 RepID=UPI0020227147|nr:hypothetical protein [Chroococcidiopsis sp. CCMEE 29]
MQFCSDGLTGLERLCSRKVRIDGCKSMELSQNRGIVLYNSHTLIIYSVFRSSFSAMLTALDYRNWLQESRHISRGRAYLFAPMLDFNVMSEVGDTPP